MAINDIAVQEFVNAIKEEPQDTNTTYNAVVSRIDEEGVVWVYLQGSEIETPTASASAEVNAGDSVTVQWRNNKLYIEGNYSNPSAGTVTVAPTVNFVTTLLDKDISADSISAATGYIGELNAKNVTAEDITADHATIKELDVESIEAASAYIEDLTTAHITTDDIEAATGYIGDLTAGNITAQNVIADHATVGSLDTNYAHISNGVIDNAKIGYADVNGLNANYAHISNGVIDNAKIGYADVNNLSANYAQINAANITDLSAQNAWVNKIMVQTGLIAHEGTVFTLDAIQVNAANITAGTIDVNRLIVTVDGEKYLVEIDPTTHQPSYEKLDGGIVEPRTITADKIVAHDITVQEITTENLVGTNGWMNLNQGKFMYTTNGSTWATATQGIYWDGTDLKIKGNIEVSAGSNVYTKDEVDEAVNTIEGLNIFMRVSGDNLIFNAVLIQGGVDVTSTTPDGDFEWFYRTPDGNVPMSMNGKSITIAKASQKYGRTVVCVWSRNQYAYLLNNSGNNLVTNTGNKLIGRTEY